MAYARGPGGANVAPVIPLSVVVAAGPDLGRRVLVDADVTVGRGTTQTLQLTDSAVSRHHLTLCLGVRRTFALGEDVLAHTSA